MQLDKIIEQYKSSFLKKYDSRLLDNQRQAIAAFSRCRTPDSGEMYVKCTHCDEAHWRPMSCGHRSCPKCQNYEVSRWIERQQVKLLPVEYFMVTFTLPYQLRDLTWLNQKIFYSILFTCVSSTLKDFGLNPDNLGVNMGMTAVLHTHSRKLDYHPHIHMVVPGGGVDKRKKQWTKSRAYEGKNLKANIFLMNFHWLKYFVPVFLKPLFNKDLIFHQKHPKNGWSIAFMLVKGCLH